MKKNKELIVITGANGQVGSYLAHNLYNTNKYQLLLIAHENTNRISDLFDNKDVFHLKIDLSKREDSIQKIINSLKSIALYPSILIHTAALRSYDAKSFIDSDVSLWNNIFDVNLQCAVNVLRACIPLMCERKYGRIVMFSSTVASIGLPMGSAYASAKAAITNLVTSIAQEYASYNIVINALSPAPIESHLEDDYNGEYLEFRKNYFNNFIKENPTHALVSMDEILLLVTTLIDKRLRHLTGCQISLSGGKL